MTTTTNPKVTETTWRRIEVTGADWTTVVRAFSPSYKDYDRPGFGPGFSNVPTDWRTRVYAAMEGAQWWYEEADPEWYAQATDTVILMARRPGFGAEREFRATETVFMSDDVFDGWEILTERHTHHVYAESGTSQSSISATREPGRGLPSLWTLVGYFPILNGELYRGCYYSTFAAAIGLSATTEAPAPE